MKNYRAPLFILGLFFSIILFFELVFKVRLFSFRMSWSNLVSVSFIRTMLFTLAYGLFVVFILRAFKRRTAKRLVFGFAFLLMFLYSSQDVYFQIASNFYSFALSSDFATGLTFLYRVTQSLEWGHLFYLVPLVFVFGLLTYVSRKTDGAFFDIRFKSYKQVFATLALAFVSFTVAIATINRDPDGDPEYEYSDWQLYREHTSSVRMINEYGLLTYLRKDLGQTIFPRQDVFDYDTQLADFFNERPSHIPNDMTDVFEGKNLILIMAESLDTYAIDETLTPNLYELLHDSWVFDNFYAPLYLRNTADTEFMVQTGFYANTFRNLSMNQYAENHFPNTLPRLFGQKGYNHAAFHNFSDRFYPRESFMPDTLGYDVYHNDESLGLEVPKDRPTNQLDYWHSDVDLFDIGLPRIIGESPFFAYFLTVSGHLPYDINRHDLVHENYPLIRDIWDEEEREEVPEEILYYHAAQWEFDVAVGHLMKTLEEEGVLDDTVIVIFGDHYAYGLERNVIWDYDTIKDENVSLDIHKVPFIIHAPGVTDEDPRHFDNLFSSVDIIPTLSNMFGLDLAYDEVMGLDAFNGISNQVVFVNDSFLTDEYFYDVQTMEFRHFNDDDFELAKLRPLENAILRRIRLNNYLLESDYFAEDDPSGDHRKHVPDDIGYMREEDD